MKQFFKFFFASCLGMLVTLFVIFLFIVGMVSQGINSSKSQDEIKANSILTLKLGAAIPERTNNAPADAMSFETDEKTGLIDMLKAIKYAKDDDDIKGIYIETSNPAMNFASLSAMRKALLDFKTSGKFIVSYADYYSEKGYYLASTADKISVNKIGGVEFNGFVAQVPYFKEMLDKIGVKYEIFYVGDFKSATEPYRLNEMSKENRQQLREYLDDVYGNYLADLSETRGIPVAELRRMSDEFLIRESEDAVKYKLIDEAGYKDMVLDDLKKRLGLEDKSKIKSISLAKYTQLTRGKIKTKAKDRVAVIYAEGTILDGAETPGSIMGDHYSKMIRDIRKNKRTKAIVLRVNSPGGSVLASEKIRRELQLAKNADIPVVVSMGDYAASGGYYIACMADSILAEKNTLTGSIGVFSMFPHLKGLMNDKVGIRLDTVKTGEFSLGINPIVEMSPQERAIYQSGVDTFYREFLQHIATGRGMTVEEVHKVAQGRIWTGSRAKKLGLVDAIGGLDDAIEIAANMAGLDKYKTYEYPKTKDPIEQIIEQFTGKKAIAKQSLIKEELGAMYPYYQKIKDIQNLQGMQVRMPFDVIIE